MKKVALALLVAFMVFSLTGCFERYKSEDVDKAAAQLTAQQNIDSSVRSMVTKGDYDKMVDNASKSLNAFKNSSAASNLPSEIVDGLSAHISVHQAAKVAWSDDQKKGQAEYDKAFNKYLDGEGDEPNFDSYLDKYNTVQEVWSTIPDLKTVAGKIAECRKSSK